MEEPFTHCKSSWSFASALPKVNCPPSSKVRVIMVSVVFGPTPKYVGLTYTSTSVDVSVRISGADLNGCSIVPFIISSRTFSLPSFISSKLSSFCSIRPNDIGPQSS